MSQTAASEDSNIVGEDEFHYLTDVIFLVENRLFKVPRLYFEEDSEIFRTMFQLPVPENLTPDGRSKEQPLCLAGIEIRDFQQLLRVMFPKNFGREESLTVPEWTSVLKLSTMWQFGEIRKLAIRRMSKLTIDTVDKVVIARDYRVMEWLITSLNELAQRKGPLGAHDVDRLGWDYALKVAEVRESFTSCPSGSSFTVPVTCSHCRTVTQGNIPGHVYRNRETHSFLDVIRRIFAQDLEVPP